MHNRGYITEYWVQLFDCPDMCFLQQATNSLNIIQCEFLFFFTHSVFQILTVYDVQQLSRSTCTLRGCSEMFYSTLRFFLYNPYQRGNISFCEPSKPGVHLNNSPNTAWLKATSGRQHPTLCCLSAVSSSASSYSLIEHTNTEQMCHDLQTLERWLSRESKEEAESKRLSVASDPCSMIVSWLDRR